MNEQVFVLYHIRASGDLLLVGLYRSEADANAAIQRLKLKPGFAEYPDCFEIHAYELGKDIWSEGFPLETDEESSVQDEAEGPDQAGYVN
ncbi:MAG: hypothetical protein ACLGSD_14535 [Acidobacteriota bacterium]